MRRQGSLLQAYYCCCCRTQTKAPASSSSTCKCVGTVLYCPPPAAQHCCNGKDNTTGWTTHSCPIQPPGSCTAAPHTCQRGTLRHPPPPPPSRTHSKASLALLRAPPLQNTPVAAAALRANINTTHTLHTPHTATTRRAAAIKALCGTTECWHCHESHSSTSTCWQQRRRVTSCYGCELLTSAVRTRGR